MLTYQADGSNTGFDDSPFPDFDNFQDQDEFSLSAEDLAALDGEIPPCNIEQPCNIDNIDSRNSSSSLSMGSKWSMSSTCSMLQEDIGSTCSMLQEDIDGIIAGTMPRKKRVREFPGRLFELVRCLKAVPRLLAAGPASQEVMEILRRWHNQAVQRVGKERPFEETELDFLKRWDNVKAIAGKGPLDEAMARARAAIPPQAANRYEQSEFRLLVSLCRELQSTNEKAGRDRFPLACRSAAAKLGVHYATVSRWLYLLCRHKVLELVEEGGKDKLLIRNGWRSGSANKYKYLGD